MCDCHAATVLEHFRLLLEAGIAAGMKPNAAQKCAEDWQFEGLESRQSDRIT